MDGKGHRLLAPIFTAGTSLVLLKTGLYHIEGNVITNICLSTALSILSASWADADHLAILPLPIATGTAKKIKSKKYNKEYYYVKVSEQELTLKLKKNKNLKYEKTTLGKYLIYYDSVRHPSIDMKAFMYLFRYMKLDKHRGWQSHSLILWTILWGLVCYLPVFLKINPILIAPIQVVLLGLGLGYLSHLVADKFTQAGLNSLRDDVSVKLSKIPFIGKLLGGVTKSLKFNYAKANNTNYAYFVGVMMVIVFWAILDFNSFKTVLIFLVKLIIKLFKDIINLLGTLLKGS